jgi:hypothetical protein
MARTRHTARKSTGRLPVGQLAPRNVPQPQESQPDIPQEATPELEPFEIELVVPESPTAQDSPAEEQQPEDHSTEDKTDEEQPPLRNTEPEKMYRDADEVESFGAESLILAGWLRALLDYLGITTAPLYRFKEVPRTGRVEFKAFFGSRILCRHKGPAFRTSRSNAVADAAWQAITSWVRSNKSRLQNSVHCLLPYRKKDQFKAYGVKKDIPRMEMVHHQDVAVELSTRLLTAQHEIETLCAQLRNADATIRGYRRMVDGQANDPYASNTDTWTTTSSVQSSGKEPQ